MSMRDEVIAHRKKEAEQLAKEAAELAANVPTKLLAPKLPPIPYGEPTPTRVYDEKPEEIEAYTPPTEKEKRKYTRRK